MTSASRRAPRAVERAQRVRHPGRHRPLLGHPSAGARCRASCSRTTSTSCATLGRGGARPCTRRTSRPRSRRARWTPPRTWTRRMVGEFVDLRACRRGRRRCPGAASWWSGALAPDLTYQRAGAVLRAAYDPPFFATYFYGLDVRRPRLHPLRRPRALRRRPARGAPPLRRAWSSATPPTSARSVGELVAGPAPGRGAARGLRLRHAPGAAVAAGVGGAGRRRPGSAARTPDAPDGFLLAVGDGIRPGATLERASVLDVAPTILYLMGLPVARDMEGRVLTEIVDERLRPRAPGDLHPQLREPGRHPHGATSSCPACPRMPEESP